MRTRQDIVRNLREMAAATGICPTRIKRREALAAGVATVRELKQFDSWGCVQEIALAAPSNELLLLRRENRDLKLQIEALQSALAERDFQVRAA